MFFVLLNFIALPTRWVVSTPMFHRFDTVFPIQPKYKYVAWVMPRGDVTSICSDLKIPIIERYSISPIMTSKINFIFRVWWSIFRKYSPIKISTPMATQWIIICL